MTPPTPESKPAEEHAAVEAALLESIDAGDLALCVSADGQPTFSLTNQGYARVETMGRPNAPHPVESLDLVDADGDRIRFAAHPGRTDGGSAVEVWLGGNERDEPEWSIEAFLTLDQLHQVVAWGAHALGISTSILASALARPYTSGEYLTTKKSAHVPGPNDDGLNYCETCKHVWPCPPVEAATVAIVEVWHGGPDSKSWPIVERVPGGWQSGRHYYPDKVVVRVRPLIQAVTVTEGRSDA